jgi:HAE1 family hydrophobic/amphiphilic exporter-1
VKLVDASIKNPITVIVGVILLVMFGLIALFRIPVQLTPNVDKAEITVNTIWPGASPQEIEREIIDEQ